MTTTTSARAGNQAPPSADKKQSAKPRKIRMTTDATPNPGGAKSIVPTAIAAIGALYCLIPLIWIVIASTKNPAQLFSTSTYLPSSGFWENLTALFSYKDGIYLQWAGNTALYAGVGGILVTVISAAAGYGLAKYEFKGRTLIFRTLVGGVLLPQIVLAIPLYLMVSQVGLTNTYWSVLVPCLISPYAIFLCRIYAEGSVPDELIEAARLDGASELRIFWSIGLRLMFPCLITVFLLQFIAIWNNYLLPMIMLTDESKYPLTKGLSLLMKTGTETAPLYSITIMGSMLSIIPVIILFLSLQRFWRMDLVSGSLKS